MVRLYIELDALKEEERASDRGVTPEMLIEKAQAILSPYTLDVKGLLGGPPMRLDNGSVRNLTMQKTPQTGVRGSLLQVTPVTPIVPKQVKE